MKKAVVLVSENGFTGTPAWAQVELDELRAYEISGLERPRREKSGDLLFAIG